MIPISDIADYYNQTQVHYMQWWNLEESKALHFGYWEKNTPDFKTALHQLTVEMAKRANLPKGCRVLDAGCGVGGSSFYLATKLDCTVNGITLSEKQLTLANRFAKEQALDHLVQFSLQDFTQTSFADNSFDAVWLCESSCHAWPKINLIQEMNRVLKPGGLIIIADYFLTGKNDSHRFLTKWAELWAMPAFNSDSNFMKPIQLYFNLVSNDNISSAIYRSSKRMFWASVAGTLPSVLYNLFHKVSRYGRTHYQSGFFQYLALRKKLWEYHIVVGVKKPKN